MLFSQFDDDNSTVSSELKHQNPRVIVVLNRAPTEYSNEETAFEQLQMPKCIANMLPAQQATATVKEWIQDLARTGMPPHPGPDKRPRSRSGSCSEHEDSNISGEQSQSSISADSSDNEKSKSSNVN